MKCRQSEELWSDYHEGSLSTPLRRDLEEHLGRCRDCRALMKEFRDVMEAMAGLPRPRPAPDNLNRILAATRPRLRRMAAELGTGIQGILLPKWGNWVIGAAAAVFVVLMFVHPPEVLSRLGGRANQMGHQGYSFVLRVYENSQQLLDELDVLRMTVGVAFEDRLDRLNERLKELEEARRKNEDPREESSKLESPLMLTQEQVPGVFPDARSLI